MGLTNHTAVSRDRAGASTVAASPCPLARASPPSLHRVDGDLHDCFLQRPPARKRRVGILREEDRERTRRDQQPRVGPVIEEPDISSRRRRDRRAGGSRRAPSSRSPPPADGDLDVDVAAVRLEACALAAAAVLLVDRDVDPIAVDDVADARRARASTRPSPRSPGIERARKRRVKRRVSSGLVELSRIIDGPG